jgi:outer membrane protein assembly factor BamB
VRYLTFDVRIRSGADRDYPIEVIDSPAGRCEGWLQFPFSADLLSRLLDDVELATLRLSGTRRRIASPDEKIVKDFGSALFNALLSGEVKGLYDVSRRLASQEGAGLQLNLQIEAPDLIQVPWEFMYDSREHDYVALGRGSPVVRTRDLPQHAPPQPIRLPLRLLGMASSPSDLPQLDVTHERNLLAQSLADLIENGAVSLDWLAGQGWVDIQEAMSRGPWHIFHFIGHGGFSEEKGEGVVALCTEDGSAHLVGATSLGRLLDDHFALRLVVLNSCEGARSAMGPMSSTADVLIQRGVPAVVAMQYQITDMAAMQFSHSFYAALARGQSTVASMSEARVAMSVKEEQSPEWAVPVLYQRSGAHVLFEVTPTPGSNVVAGPSRWWRRQRPWQRLSRKKRRLAAAATSLFLVCIVAFGLARFLAPQQPDVQWTFRTPGAIASSPALAGGAVYFGGHDGGVYAVDAETGIQRWRFQTEGVVSSSPSVTDQVVYIGSQDGHLYALDAGDGTERWRRSLNGLVRSSPTVADGVVYVGSDQPGLFAVDAQTGDIIWDFAASGSIMSSPAVVGDTVYVGSQDGRLYAVDSKTGAERWQVEIGEVFSSPTVEDGLVYVGSNDGHLYCITAVSGLRRWRFPTGDKVGSSPEVSGGTAYVGSHDGYVYAVDARSGGERWRFRAADLVFSSPTVVGGVVYVGSHARNIYAIDADTGKEEWRFVTGGIVGSSPAVADGALFVGSDDGLLYSLRLP